MLIDAMANSSQSDAEADAASTLRHQLIYNGEVLDIALDSVRSYKEGTQSLAYLDSSIYLAYALLRMLEKWGKAGEGGSGEEMYVRKKRARRRKAKKGVTEEEGVPDVEEIEPEEDDEVVVETMFTFEAFEAVCWLLFLSFLSQVLTSPLTRNSPMQRLRRLFLLTLRDIRNLIHPRT